MTTDISVEGDFSEGHVQSKIRLEAAQKGIFLWRNNSGCWKDKVGNWIRYGLGNDSKKICDKFKSSDLIGIRKVRITKEMVGTDIGQFVAREVKKSKWKYNPKDLHTAAQLAFIKLVTAMGGDASFAQEEGTL